MHHSQDNAWVPGFVGQALYAGLESAEAREKAEGPEGAGVLCVCRTSEGGQRDFLQKILSAVRLDPQADVQLLFLNDGERFGFISAFPSCKRLILFGVQPERLGLHLQMERYVPQQVADRQCLWADGLSLIAEDKKAKSALWAALQAMFLA